MKYFLIISFCLLSCSLFADLHQSTSPCACKSCKCTVEKNCGCMEGKKCSCSEKCECTKMTENHQYRG